MSITNLTSIEFRSLFRYDKRWQVLICVHCEHDVISKNVIRHLYDIHQWRERSIHHSLKSYSHYPSLTRSTIFHVSWTIHLRSMAFTFIKTINAITAMICWSWAKFTWAMW